MDLGKYSQFKFGVVLGTGALIAAVLCIQCVRTYLYIDSVLIPQQAEREAQRAAGALSAMTRDAGIDDPRTLAPYLQRAIESAGDRVLWMRVLDSENNVLSQAGSLRGRYLESELQLARRVQSDLQPKAHLVSPYIEFAASAIAADHVGGDFYDIFQLECGKVAVVVGDVSGKGVPAALLVSVLQGAIRSSTASQHESACEQINRMLCERTANKRFATLFWAVFDPVSGSLRYVNAGHGAPILMRAYGNRIERLADGGGPILGSLPNARYSAGEIQIDDHDRLILYTDGVREATNKDGQEFGDERLIALLSEDRNRTPAGLCERVGQELSEFADAQRTPHDDRTVLVVRFLSRQMSANERGLGAAMAQVA